ncbi:MAG: phosphotransacetylase family protein [Ardenticatenaceae bacterium]|nr:phosphotransacetylase family protein [Ardenticatenaceae bacterium]
MATLYLLSTSPNSGKTAVAVALGQRYQEQGRRVAWFKPISTTVVAEAGRLVDQDAQFVRAVLNLPQSVTELSSFALTPETVREVVETGEPLDGRDEIRRRFAAVAAEADLTLVEGGTTPVEGTLFGLDARSLVEMLDARVLVVARWGSVFVADEILWVRGMLGARVAGVVLNAVPKSRETFAQGAFSQVLAARGVPVLAVIPEEKILGAMSVRELAEVLGGTVLTAHEHLDELVENLSVGAMSVDSALSYFRRKPNKAVITGGDRPDIQLAALETSTKCMILTGNLQPSPVILGRAEEVGVPIVVVRHDTLTTVEIAEQYFGKIRFHQPQKLRRFIRLFEGRMDFSRLDAVLWGGQ